MLRPDLMQRARALQQQRMGMSARPGLSPQPSGLLAESLSPISGSASPLGGLTGGLAGGLAGGMPANFKLPPAMKMTRPSAPGFPKSAPVVPGTSLSERRAMKLGGLPGSGVGSNVGTPRLSDIGAGPDNSHRQPARTNSSKLDEFKEYIDAEKGWITFEGAATITRTGVNFASGQTFNISLDDIEVLDELGKGNYGTVFKVRHARPKVPRFGQGLSGFKGPSRQNSSSDTDGFSSDTTSSLSPSSEPQQTSGVVMAMKEIRVELDKAKFVTIHKELMILHKCVSPYIIDFYGAFFQEGTVYMCIEYMDGGSIDKLYDGGIPESVLRKITRSTIMGLKTLKDDHNIIHRDVKPTNILANTQGRVKICDFGVSGNLVASIAKTNIGCQSYMAPERITGGGMSQADGNAGGTYSVQSDIWSLSRTIIECALGRYLYPQKSTSTIFSQLN